MTANGPLCELEDHRSATIIRFRELPDIQTETAVCEFLAELATHNRAGASENAILDMTHIERLPSRLLGALVAFRKVVQHGGGVLLIANCSARLLELMHVCQLHRVFDFCASVEDALQRLTTLVTDEPLETSDRPKELS